MRLGKSHEMKHASYEVIQSSPGRTRELQHPIRRIGIWMRQDTNMLIGCGNVTTIMQQSGQNYISRSTTP